MELKLGIGLDDLIFGATEAEVMALIGDPDRTFTNEDDDNELIYQFNSRKLRLSFYKDQNRRLGYIRCGNSAITYNKQPLIGQPIQTLTETTLKDITLWNIDSYEFFDVYFNEANAITLNVEYEEVADLEFGVMLNQDETYKWPE